MQRREYITRWTRIVRADHDHRRETRLDLRGDPARELLLGASMPGRSSRTRRARNVPHLHNPTAHARTLPPGNHVPVMPAPCQLTGRLPGMNEQQLIAALIEIELALNDLTLRYARQASTDRDKQITAALWALTDRTTRLVDRLE